MANLALQERLRLFHDSQTQPHFELDMRGVVLSLLGSARSMKNCRLSMEYSNPLDPFVCLLPLLLPAQHQMTHLPVARRLLSPAQVVLSHTLQKLSTETDDEHYPIESTPRTVAKHGCLGFSAMSHQLYKMEQDLPEKLLLGHLNLVLDLRVSLTPLALIEPATRGLGNLDVFER